MMDLRVLTTGARIAIRNIFGIRLVLKTFYRL